MQAKAIVLCSIKTIKGGFSTFCTTLLLQDPAHQNVTTGSGVGWEALAPELISTAG